MFLGMFGQGAFPAASIYQMTVDQVCDFTKRLSEQHKAQKAAMKNAPKPKMPAPRPAPFTGRRF
jgi:hypothetical protein